MSNRSLINRRVAQIAAGQYPGLVRLPLEGTGIAARLAKYGLAGFIVWTVINMAGGLAWGVPVGLAILARG